MVFCNGSGCLVCWRLLDQEQIALGHMSATEREADRRIYGVDRAALHQAGPAVVSINGAVASLAVTEFMVHVTRLRDPVGQLTYRGDLATVRRSMDPPEEGCFYCAAWRGRA